MKMRNHNYIILFICLLAAVSCKKVNEDTDKADVDPKYRAFLSANTNWKYIFHSIDASKGIDNKSSFYVYGMKTYNNVLKIYLATTIKLQQSNMTSFKLGAVDLDNTNDYTEEKLDYGFNDLDPMLKEGIITLDDYSFDFYYTYHDNYAWTRLLEIKNSETSAQYKGDVMALGQPVFTGSKYYNAQGFIHELGANGNEMEIWNDISKGNLAIKYFYHQPNDELYEVFISKNGYLTSAVMQKETTSTLITHMVSTGYTTEVKFAAPVELIYKKKADNNYTILVYSKNLSRMDEFDYNPITNKFTPMYLNLALSATPSGYDLASDGSIYVSTGENNKMTTLSKFSKGTWKTIPLDIIKSEYSKQDLAAFRGFYIKSDKLIGIVSGFNQISILQFIE